MQEHYHVFAIDLPGMGNSHALPAADSRTVASLLKSFYRQLRLDKIHLVAHDVGAWIATTFALEYETLLKSQTVLDAGIPGLIPDEAFPESALQNKSYQHKLAIPILAIGGENVQGLNVGIAMQKIALAKIRSAIIANCGHYIAEEQPEIFLELVLDFFKNL